MHANRVLPGPSQPPTLTLRKRGPRLSERVANRSRPLARRLLLGIVDGAGKAVGGFVIGYIIWVVQAR